jgi:Zn-dependent metalloprotease
MTSHARATVALCGLLLHSAASSAAGQESAAAKAALSDLRSHALALGLERGDVDDVIVTSEGFSSHTKVTHVYLRQRYQGIDVWRADLTVNVGPDGAILNRAGTFVRALPRAVGRTTPVIDAIGAFRAAASHLELSPLATARVVKPSQGPAQSMVLDGGEAVAGPIPVRLAYWPHPDGRLRLAWMLEIELRDGSHRWLVFVDAETGKLLDKHDLILSGRAQSLA